MINNTSLIEAITRRWGQDRDLRPLAAVGGITLLLMLTLWLKSDNHQLEENLTLQESRLDKMRRSAELATTLKQQMPAQEKLDHNQSLLSTADQTIRSSGLEKNLTRIEPDEKNAVHIWFDTVAFDPLLSWLTSLQKDHGVGVSRLTVRRSDKPGIVQARLTLTNAASKAP